MLKSIITTNILMLVSKMRLFKTLPKTRPSNGYFTLIGKYRNLMNKHDLTDKQFKKLDRNRSVLLLLREDC